MTASVCLRGLGEGGCPTPGVCCAPHTSRPSCFIGGRCSYRVLYCLPEGGVALHGGILGIQTNADIPSLQVPNLCSPERDQTMRSSIQPPPPALVQGPTRRLWRDRSCLRAHRARRRQRLSHRLRRRRRSRHRSLRSLVDCRRAPAIGRHRYGPHHPRRPPRCRPRRARSLIRRCEHLLGNAVEGTPRVVAKVSTPTSMT